MRESVKKQFIAVTHTRQKLQRGGVEGESGGEGVAKGIEELSRQHSGQGALWGV